MKFCKSKIAEPLKLLSVFSIILLIYVLTGCPIKLLTGISCAGCGMTRAYLELFKLNFHEAFHYHPLFFCPIIFVIAYILTKFGFPAKYAKAIYCIIAVLFLGVYIFRMLNSKDGIVVFEPQNAFIFKVIKYVISVIRQ